MWGNGDDKKSNVDINGGCQDDFGGRTLLVDLQDINNKKGRLELFWGRLFVVKSVIGHEQGS